MFRTLMIGAHARHSRRRAMISFQGRENKVMHSLLKPVLLAMLFSLSSVGAVLAQNAYITNLNSSNVMYR
jgi:hypothetical protein